LSNLASKLYNPDDFSSSFPAKSVLSSEAEGDEDETVYLGSLILSL
jgi:hypothetical protein